MLIKHTLFSRRNILGMLLGIAASFVLISLIKNYILASILGMMITLITVNLRQPGEMASLGFVTGSVAGLYWGTSNYLVSSAAPLNFTDMGLIIAMLSGLVLTGLTCAGYAFVRGKFLQLYRRGERPFF